MKYHLDSCWPFVQGIFDSMCEVTDVNTIYVGYINQMTGPRLIWQYRASFLDEIEGSQYQLLSLLFNGQG